MTECDCPYCTYIPLGNTLPLPVHIPIHPHSHFAAWGWLTVNDGDGPVGIDVLAGSTTTTFHDHDELVRHLTSYFPVPGNPYDADIDGDICKSVNRISIRTSIDTYTTLGYGTTAVLPTGRATSMPFLPQGVECVKNVPRPLDVPRTTQQKTESRKRRKTPTPSTSPPRSPIRTEDGSRNSYDVTKIGGDKYEIRRLVAACPVWDDEVVLCILELGARPPLVDVSELSTLDLLCSFRAPDGKLVTNVRVHRSLISVMYKR